MLLLWIYFEVLSLSPQHAELRVNQLLLTQQQNRIEDDSNLSAPDLRIKYRNIWNASKSGGIRAIEAFLKVGQSVDQFDEKKNTPLHYACEQKSFEVVKWLLDQGVDVDQKNIEGWSALQIAIEKEETEIVNLLLKKGASVTGTVKGGRTSLHIACQEGQKNIVEKLLENGINIDYQDDEGITAFHIASSEGYHEVVSLLLKSGANVEEKDDTGCTALHFACVQGHIKVVEMLVNKVENVNQQTEVGVTALQSACESGRIEIVKLLLDNGSDIKITNAIGWQAINIAVNKGYYDIVALLIKRGADVNTIRQSVHENKTPLHYACTNGYQKIVELLLNNQANIDQPDVKGVTPLHLAVQGGHIEIVRLLLDKGADMNRFCAKKKVNALYSAIFNNRIDILQLLIENGAKLNQRNAEGQTPLHCASGLGHTEIAELLLRQTLPMDYINRQDERGQTALHDAFKNKHHHMIQILLKNKASVMIENKEKDTFLWLILNSLDKRNLSYLKKNDVSIDTVDAEGDTPLHKAIKRDDDLLIDFLIRQGASLGLRDRKGWSAFHLIVARNQLEAIPTFKEIEERISCIKREVTEVDSRTERNSESDELSILSKLTISIEENIKRKIIEVDPRTGRRSEIDVLDILLDRSMIETIEYFFEEGYDKYYDAKDLEKLVWKLSDNTWNQRNQEIVSIVVERRPDLFHKEEGDKKTLFHQAFEEGEVHIVNLCLKKGNWGIGEFDQGDKSALSRAIMNGHFSLVKLLVECGADVNEWRSGRHKKKSALSFAVMKGHFDLVELLLKRGADVNEWVSQANGNSTNSSVGCSILDLAMQHEGLNYVNLLKMLLRFGVNISGLNYRGLSLLHEVVGKKIDKNLSARLLQFIFEDEEAEKWRQSLDINIRSFQEENTPLLWAVRYQNQEALKILIEQGADLNIPDYSGRTALHWACEMGKNEVIKTLIKHQADIYVEDKSGVTPLMLAVKSGCRENVELLISDEKWLNKRDQNGESALFYAVKYLKIEIIDVLLSSGAYIYFKNKNKKSIFDLVGKSEDLKFKKIDSQKVLDQLKKYKKNNPESLIKAIWVEDVDLALSILKRKKQLETRDGRNRSPLMLACEVGNQVIVEEILGLGNVIKTSFLHPLEEQDTQGKTVLHLASEKGKTHIVELLLRKGVKIHAEDKGGNTALHLASINGHEKVVELLLKENININIKNKAGEIPLVSAVHKEKVGVIIQLVSHHMEQGDWKIIDLILKKNMTLVIDIISHEIDKLINRKKEDFIYELLYESCEKSYEKLVYVILQKGVSVDHRKQDKNYQTALHIATIHKQHGVISVLLEHGATVDLIEFSNNRTPLFFAVSNQDKVAVTLLMQYGAKIDKKDKKGQTVLDVAETEDWVKLLKKLSHNQTIYIQEGQKVACRRFRGKTDDLNHGQTLIPMDLKKNNGLEAEQSIYTDPHVDQEIYTDIDGQQAIYTDIDGQQAIYTDIDGQQAIYTDMGGQQEIYTDMGGQQEIYTDMGGQQEIYENPDQSDVSTTEKARNRDDDYVDMDEGVENLKNGKRYYMRVSAPLPIFKKSQSQGFQGLKNESPPPLPPRKLSKGKGLDCFFKENLQKVSVDDKIPPPLQPLPPQNDSNKKRKNSEGEFFVNSDQSQLASSGFFSQSFEERQRLELLNQESYIYAHPVPFLQRRRSSVSSATSSHGEGEICGRPVSSSSFNSGEGLFVFRFEEEKRTRSRREKGSISSSSDEPSPLPLRLCEKWGDSFSDERPPLPPRLLKGDKSQLLAGENVALSLPPLPPKPNADHFCSLPKGSSSSENYSSLNRKSHFSSTLPNQKNNSGLYSSLSYESKKQQEPINRNEVNSSSGSFIKGRKGTVYNDQYSHLKKSSQTLPNRKLAKTQTLKSYYPQEDGFEVVVLEGVPLNPSYIPTQPIGIPSSNETRKNSQKKLRLSQSRMDMSNLKSSQSSGCSDKNSYYQKLILSKGLSLSEDEKYTPLSSSPNSSTSAGGGSGGGVFISERQLFYERKKENDRRYQKQHSISEHQEDSFENFNQDYTNTRETSKSDDEYEEVNDLKIQSRSAWGQMKNEKIFIGGEFKEYVEGVPLNRLVHSPMRVSLMLQKTSTLSSS